MEENTFMPDVRDVYVDELRHSERVVSSTYKEMCFGENVTEGLTIVAKSILGESERVLREAELWFSFAEEEEKEELYKIVRRLVSLNEELRGRINSN